MESAFLIVIAGAVVVAWKRWVTSAPETDLPPITPPSQGDPPPPHHVPSPWDL